MMATTAKIGNKINIQIQSTFPAYKICLVHYSVQHMILLEKLDYTRPSWSIPVEKHLEKDFPLRL